MKFEDVRVGMKVRITEWGWGSGSDTVGKICEVIKIVGDRAVLKLPDGVTKDVAPCALEPVLGQSQSSVSCRFHVGQPVRVIENGWGFGVDEIGQVFVISQILDSDDRGESIIVSGRNTEQRNSSSSRIKSVEPAYSLEVGCKVRVIDPLRLRPFEGVITHILSNSAYVSFPDGEHTLWGNYNLIVLEPAPKNYNTIFTATAEIKAGSPLSFSGNDVYSDGRKVGEIIRESMGKYNIGIDWGSLIQKYESKGAYVKITYPSMEESKMENNDKKYKELAERMKDEYVGFGKTDNTGRSNTVFLKKAGECSIERRDVTMTLTVDDIETLLKQKGITKALGVHEIDAYSGTYTVGIIKFVPIKKDKFTEANEAV